MVYSKLSIEKTITTIDKLSLRIYDRFPDSSLYSVCMELKLLAEQSNQNLNKINKPYYFFRVLFSLLIFLIIFISFIFIKRFDIDFKLELTTSFFQSTEALVNGLALIGAAFYFLYKLEDSYKKKIILKVFHELRSIAHVIDMHQLTKDPSVINIPTTNNSPDRLLTPNQLYRYLDYCSEMLSLTSKIAAFYANENRDVFIVNSIHELEILTSTLSRKIWQKIILINQINN